jgi:hypothetical protein
VVGVSKPQGRQGICLGLPFRSHRLPLVTSLEALDGLQNGRREAYERATMRSSAGPRRAGNSPVARHNRSVCASPAGVYSPLHSHADGF